MSIIYSYPEQSTLNAGDMLIGTSVEKVGGKQKNVTKNFTVQQIADFINQGTGFVDPVATDFQIPVFNQEGKKITGSIMSQNAFPNGSIITISGGLTATDAITTSGNLSANGVVTLGSQNNLISLNSLTKLGGPIKDSAGTLGNVNQILLSTGSGNVVWQNYEAGLTYEGTWDADANTTNGLSNSPALLPGVGVSGHFYIVNVEGTTSLGSGLNDWHVGDWAVFLDEGGQPASWQKIDNTSTLVGSGVAKNIAMWTNATTLNDSLLSQDSSDTKVMIDGLLEIKGDGISQDGRIKLNCWNNNHGVTIQSPPHSGTLASYTLVLPTSQGTANQVLTTDGGTPSQLSWTDVESNISIAGSGNTDANTVKGLAGFSSDDFTVSSNGWVEAKDFNGSTPGYVPDASSAIAGTFLKEDGTWSAIAPTAGVGFYTTGNGTILSPQTTSTQLAISDILASGSVYTFLTALSLGDVVQITDGTVNGFFTFTIAGSGPNGWRFAYISGEIPTNFSTATNAINLRNTAAGVVGTVTGTGTQNYVTKWSSGGTGIEDSTIFDNGNVGIGTTSPSRALDVRSAGVVANLQASSASGLLDLKSAGTAASDVGAYNGIRFYNGDGFKMAMAHITEASGSGYLQFGTNWAAGVGDAMAIHSSGNVGIGTTSPSAKLEVHGNISSVSNLENGTAQISILNSNLATPAEQFYVGNNLADVDLGNKRGALKLFTGVSERIRITSTGKVGIGTASPAVSLDVSATDAVQMPIGLTSDRPTGANGMLRYNSTNNGFEGYINGNWGDIGGGSSGGLIFRGTFDASTGSITSGGSLYTCPAGGPGGTVDIAIGDLYIVTTAGSFYCSGTNLNVGDEVICVTAATAGNSSVTDWNAVASGAGGAVTGSGTTNYVPKFTGATVVGNSSIFNDTSGNVGIGTATPGAKLEVQGSSGATTGTGVLYANNNDDAFSLVINNAGTSDQNDRGVFDARVSGSSVMRINNSGNVGIGTTSPTTKLDVIVGSNERILIGAVGSNPIITAANAANSAYKSLQLGGSDVKLLTNGTEKMRIASNGDVGIGTTSPAEKLSVAGAIIITGGITGHGANRVSISQEGANGAFWQSYGANSSTYGTFSLRQASSDFSLTRTPLFIDSTGNVGIGTTSPQVSLDLSANTDAILVPNGDTAARPSGILPGMIRYNTETSEFEGYSGTVNVSGSWGALGSSGGGLPTKTVVNVTISTATPTLNLTVVPSSTAYVDLYVDGVYQNKNTFTVNISGILTLNTGNFLSGSSVEAVTTT